MLASYVSLNRALSSRRIASVRVFSFSSVGDLLAEDMAGPSEVGFKNLPHIHTGRHAQGLSTIRQACRLSRYGMSSSGRMRAMTPLLP